ncbi:MAG: AbrB/MazE/SpoVT family DNA-binding domain-containing protein [Anaerolineae bacterium]|nr:AbrB/MazE/SpoVT family DNA-binding domain-containing protein [Anaerolineae bacterium]
MITNIKKWGNSLALRLPKSFAAEIGLDENSEVELIIEADQLVIRPVKPATLDQLLEGITPDNIHGEVDTGSPQGIEAW